MHVRIPKPPITSTNYQAKAALEKAAERRRGQNKKLKTSDEYKALVDKLLKDANMEDPIYRQPRKPVPRGFASREAAYDAGLFLGAVAGSEKAQRIAKDKGIFRADANTGTGQEGGFVAPDSLASTI